MKFLKNFLRAMKELPVCTGIFLTTIIILLLTTIEFSGTTLHPVELRIFAAIADLRTPQLSIMMKAISHLGATVTILALAVFLGWVLIMNGFRRQARFAGLTILTGLILNPFFKILIIRPRPHLEFIEALTRLPGSYAFPSGHTVGATVGYGMVILVLQQLHRDGVFPRGRYILPILTVHGRPDT